MSILTITGKDSLTLNVGTSNAAVALDTLSFGEASKFEFPNELATVKTGKEGNSVIGLNNAGRNGKLTLRVPLGCDVDTKLQSRLAAWLLDPTTFVAISGTFVKQFGDGTSKVNNVTYSVLGGVPLKIPGASYQAEGDPEQGVATWELMFALVTRTIS